MKKLLLIFIFAIAITTKTSAFRDTLQINNNTGISAYCQHWANGFPSGIQITTYTCNVSDTIVFRNAISTGIVFMVNTTSFPSTPIGQFFQYKVLSTDVPSFIVTASAFTTTLTALTVYVNNTTTEITEKTNTNSLTLFPNPTKNTFTLAGLKTANLSVYNQLGSLVKQQAFLNETIALNIADLPQGIYMVEVLADGKRSVSKLVKE